jgi:type III secretion system YscQ/HrcQ family protein
VQKNVGENAIWTSFLLSPLEGEVAWIMSKVDIHKLTSFSLFKNGDGKGFLSEVLEEGYFRYLLLETIFAFSKLELFSDFSLKFSESQEPQEEAYLCQDIQLKVDGHLCSGRLIFSSSLQKSWKNHFATSPALFSDKIASSIDLLLSLQIGTTTLLPSQWQKVTVGDFILLDSMEYNPRKEKFSLLLSLQDRPLFLGKMQEEKIELTQYASFPKESSMENKKQEETTEISLADIPMNIVVEMGHIPITLQKLTQLQPGNFLEVPALNEKVSLMVGGKRIARAELVYIGEALGVRILEIG